MSLQKFPQFHTPMLKHINLKSNWYFNNIKGIIKSEFNLEFINCEGNQVLRKEKNFIYGVYDNKTNRTVVFKI